MFRSVITAAALAASVSADAGEVDGKALLCEDLTYGKASLSGFYFQEGKVFRSMVQRGRAAGDVVVGEWEMTDAYDTNIDTVRWEPTTLHSAVLDRKTLSMKTYTWDSYTKQWSVAQEWACELAESMDAYHQALEAERVKVEERTAERMKENKI